MTTGFSCADAEAHSSSRLKSHKYFVILEAFVLIKNKFNA